MSKQGRRFQLYALLALFDAVAILLAFLAAGLLRPEMTFGANGLRLALLITPIYLLVAINGNAFGYQVLVNWKRGLAKAIGALTFAMAAVLFVAFFSRASLEFSRLVFGTGAAAAIALVAVGRYGFNALVKRTLGSVLRTELIILDNCELPPLGDAWVIDAAAYGLRPNLRDPNMLDRLGTAVSGADFVLVCCAVEDRAAWSLLLKGTDVQGFVLAPEFDEAGANRIMRYEGQSVMQVASGPLDVRSRAIKRAMDLAVTVPAIIALSPLLLTVAMAIKLDSKGPVLFRQQRLGRSNRLFSVFKFRSMHVEHCDAEGNRSTTRNDRRVTRVGALIRAVSIDELPQLFNVLLGEMSLVGPRPHALGSLAGKERFWEVDQRYWHRHALKPGITGLAQVRGLRGETRERDDLVKRLQADLEYLNDWSLGRDIAILLATFRVIVHDKAY
ncbi:MULTISPECIES: sugar transferase [unclassified Sphingomonas]|uniref:sugar transferase n=1 Tax=unclassified Sphingomonas TaxID=196159 RepID=UPI001F58933C|nr:MULTISPECIES: sugar transferase [unclassified Sphingomonas]